MHLYHYQCGSACNHEVRVFVFCQVVPDVRREDDMDIRRYVWIKKVPGGQEPDCEVVSGVVFTKNVAHKKMTCHFTQPRILMLGCAIEYQVCI